MTGPYPPPPPTYAPRKTRPSAVTKNAMFLFVVGIICIVIGVLEFVFIIPPWSYVVGVITIIIAALALIDGLGLFMGQSWALTISGWKNSQWAQAPDVREYFGLPPAYPAYAPSTATAPPPPPMTVSSVIKEKEVVREVVMIPCKYCGALMPQTVTACPSCGAKRSA